MLILKRPISFFDIESTGVDVVKDRIVELAVVKRLTNGELDKKRWLLNPERPIPAETTAIHGISDEMVVNAPTFKEKAKEIAAFISDSDLGGFNSNKFDIPMLGEEFERAREAGIDVDFNFHKRLAVDVQNIFHRMEPRTLSAAVKFYCGRELIDAHSALADTEATHDVFMAQLERYSEEFEKEATENGSALDIAFLSKISNRGKVLDFAGFIRENADGEAYLSFGKYKGRTIRDLLKENPGYFSWIQKSDFPLFTKRVLTELQLKISFEEK
jgi:DNA polymerase-3 subunit epsilon